jgi:hypothetical protein
LSVMFLAGCAFFNVIFRLVFNGFTSCTD